MAWYTERPIAHRGLHTESIPENSLGAFRNAIEADYAVELDVRLSADGVPVVFHDASLERLVGRNDTVAGLGWDDLAECTLGATDEPIPRLEDALETIAGEVPVLVEIKSEGRPGMLESSVADRIDDYGGEFAVQSFNPLTVAWFRRHRPDWSRGQLAGFLEDVETVGRVQRAIQKRLLTNWYSRPDFIGYEHRRLPYWPVRWHRKLGTPVLAWTIRSHEDRSRVAEYADNVIFEEIRP
jgi:glycerophosphoryl diester phosphodiesterase